MDVKNQVKKIGIFIGCLLLSGCWYKQKKIDQIQDGSLVVLNVLGQEYYTDCHIKGSINVAFDSVEQFARTLNQNAEIVVYCSNYQCTTSTYVAKKLKSLGYNQVYVYEGGMAEWYQRGLPVEGPSKASYLTKLVKKPTIQQNDILSINIENLAQKMGIDNIGTELAA